EEIVLQWYNKLQPLFRNTLKKRFEHLSYDTIEDLYQDAFLAVHENIRLGRVKENSSWSAYIIQIGLNLASKQLRVASKMDSIDHSDFYNEEGQSQMAQRIEKLINKSDAGDESLFSSAASDEVLGKELGHIPEPCSSIIRLYYYDSLSMNEIATAVNFKNATTAKSKKSQCMKTLITRVKEAFNRIDTIN
ncbi:MAG: RNA polymerase sigma factor, partial [Phocaeicola sp.]